MSSDWTSILAQVSSPHMGANKVIVNGVDQVAGKGGVKNVCNSGDNLRNKLICSEINNNDFFLGVIRPLPLPPPCIRSCFTARYFCVAAKNVQL